MPETKEARQRRHSVARASDVALTADTEKTTHFAARFQRSAQIIPLRPRDRVRVAGAWVTISPRLRVRIRKMAEAQP